MALHPTVGHLKPDSDRADWWRDVYGSLDVPLRSIVPLKIVAGSDDYFYEINLEKLTPEQFEKVCSFVSMRFGASLEEVRAKLKVDGGLPIRESELEGIAFDARMVL